jgi:uncharacterized protein YndB with AHSA1/START domain
MLPSDREILITRIFNTPRKLVAVEHGFSGEYQEIVSPERLVSTERYEPVPGSDHLNTLTLTEQDGTTTLHIRVQHQSKEQRDGHLQSGMEMGLHQSLNRLEEFLKSVK